MDLYCELATKGRYSARSEETLSQQRTPAKVLVLKRSLRIGYGSAKLCSFFS